MEEREQRGINAIEDVFVAGHSALDLTQLPLESIEAADRFLRGYGFDLSVEAQAEEAERLRVLAVDFLESVLLRGVPIPSEVRNERDLRRLLLWASTDADARRPWACSILRVAHTHAHAHAYFDGNFGPRVHEQILRRFRAHVFEENGRLTLGRGPDAVPLHAFEVRPRKTLEAVVLKLLKAAENVAAPVFDHIGVRIVTHYRYGCLRVIRYLERHDVVTFANIVPTRSRNSLLDLDWVRAVEHGLRCAGQDEATVEATLREVIEAHARNAGTHREHNPQSAQDYRAIQFTGRELVRVDAGEHAFRRFFQPYEVQILDAEANRQNREGFASHEAYKARQLRVAQRRVLGPLYELVRDR